MPGSIRLVGRDEDATRVLSALRRSGRCTVVGPGGVGKSALALAVSHADVGRRVVWVDGEPVADSDVLLDQVLRGLGAERLPGQSPADAVRSALEGSAVLVVLDGVEHLGDDLATSAEGWASSSAGPWWLVTSRRPLGAALRPVVQLAPLPTSRSGEGSAAAALLIEEVASRGGDVDLLTADQERFQHLLDATGGLPVAIQLTADHIARFGVRFAADRPAPADEVVRRCIHRTLVLLTPHERAVFELLGLTAGSFTIDLLAVYAGGTAEAGQRLAGRLVDHGLLLALDGRFDLLPPIRDGARSLLDQRGATDEALQSLIERSLAAGASSGDTPRTSVLADNLDTFAHLAWLAVRRPALGPRAVDLVHRLFGPMYEQLRQRELLTLLEALLATDPAESADTDMRTQAETARLAAICASECDTIPHARRWLDRAHALADRVGDQAVQARTWSTDAWLALDAGDYRNAVTAAERAIGGVADEPGEVALASLRCIAEAALAMGDLDRAEEIAADVLARADGPKSFDGLLARTTLGWCLVERGKHAEAVSHARRLAGDLPDRSREASEIAVEAELIAIAADPRIHPVAPSLDNDHRFTWWMRLQQRVRLAAQLPIADSWEHVLHTAADVLVLADLVPLAYPRLCATILLADAALAGGDIRQAARSYEQALRDAARGPNRLRGADALDGAAVLAEHLGHHQMARAAAGAAARIRVRAGAAPWPRPSLPSTVAPTGPVPDGWVRDGTIAAIAIDEIARTVRAAPRADPLTPLTHAERQIARLVRQGLTNQEIADHLVISRRTVESHLSRIFRKLDLRTRTQLATLPTRGESPP